MNGEEATVAQLTTIALTDAERAQYAQAVAVLPDFRVTELDDALLLAAASAGSRLPTRLRAASKAFARQGQGGGLLVRGVPIDEVLPATPVDGGPALDKRSRVSESALLLAAFCLGSPIGYREEKRGLLVHDICPSPGCEERQENSGSVYFELHTENAFHPFRPNHVSLLCLRADHDGAASTMVATATDALSLLAPSDVAILRQNRFQHRMPSSFIVSGHAIALESRPVVTGPEADPRLCVDAHNTVAMDADADDALRRLVAALEASLVGCQLRPGDLLVVDNDRAVHARSGFAPRYDGRDRWLQRTFTLRDLAPLRSGRYPGSHVLSLAPEGDAPC